MGTGGTLMGVGRYLKSVKPSVTIVGVEPVMGHTIQGLKNMTESMGPRHLSPRISSTSRRWWRSGEAFETTRLLATREGLFVGTLGRGCGGGGRAPGEMIDHGTIVTILPDRGDRYLSTMQFRSVCAKCPP